jgi:hypothetical protein
MEVRIEIDEREWDLIQMARVYPSEKRTIEEYLPLNLPADYIKNQSGDFGNAPYKVLKLNELELETLVIQLRWLKNELVHDYEYITPMIEELLGNRYILFTWVSHLLTKIRYELECLKYQNDENSRN